MLATALIQGIPLLPLLIFVAEMCVVTVSTVRIIAVSRGLKALAAVLGFFEITLWLFAIGQIMSNLSDPACYIAFAAGFTLGNYLGITLEEKMALGSLVVRIITRHDATALWRACARRTTASPALTPRARRGRCRLF